MVRVRLLGPAAEAAGRRRDDLPGGSVQEVLAEAVSRYGETFEAVLATSALWLNGEAAQPSTAVTETDEVAVLPPVSGGQ